MQDILGLQTWEIFCDTIGNGWVTDEHPKLDIAMLGGFRKVCGGNQGRLPVYDEMVWAALKMARDARSMTTFSLLPCPVMPR